MLNGVEIYKAKASYINFIDDDVGFFKKNKYIMTKTVITYTSDEPCNGKYYDYCSISLVLDFSGDSPVISNGFTPDSDNSVIDWVSWGKGNAIIFFVGFVQNLNTLMVMLSESPIKICLNTFFINNASILC
jgi:hypothetical protein